MNFEDNRTKILKAIEDKILAKGLIVGDPEGFILLDGFINISIQKELGGGVVFGGPTVPSVAIVGKSTGIIHHFALKALIPDANI